MPEINGFLRHIGKYPHKISKNMDYVAKIYKKNEVEYTFDVPNMLIFSYMLFNLSYE